MLVPLRDHSSVAPSRMNAIATSSSTHVITGPAHCVATSASAATTNGSRVRKVHLTRQTVNEDLKLVNLDERAG
jgi:uncharacterized protein YabE (DUF348 family)